MTAINSTTYVNKPTFVRSENYSKNANGSLRLSSVTTSSSSMQAEKHQRIRSATNPTPDYRAKKARGDFIPPRSFSHSSTITKYWNGHMDSVSVNTAKTQSSLVTRSTYGFSAAPQFNFSSGISVPVVPYPSNLYFQSKSEALDALRDMKVNLAQAFAERLQTVNLFKDVTNRLAKGILAARAGNFVAAAGFLSTPSTRQTVLKELRFVESQKHLRPDQKAASAWLAAQYGVRPLLGDVEGSAVTLARRSIEFPDRYRFNGIGKAVFKDSGTAVGDTSQNGYVRIYNTIVSSGRVKIVNPLDPGVSASNSVAATVDYKINRTVRTRIDACIDPTNVIGLVNRVGLTNPALLAWEVIPFSFVVDWLLPIGDFLSNLDVGLGMSWLGGSTSTKTRVALRGRIYAGGSPSPFIKTGNSDLQAETVSESFVRSVETSYALPFPSFKNPFSPTHLANGLALLSVLTGRRANRPVPRHLVQHNAYRLKNFSIWFV